MTTEVHAIAFARGKETPKKETGTPLLSEGKKRIPPPREKKKN